MNDIQRNNKAGSILCAGRGCSLLLSDRPREESHTPSPVASGEVGYMSGGDIEGDEAQLHSLRPPPPLHTLASHRARPGPLNTPACPVVKRGPRTQLKVRQRPHSHPSRAPLRYTRGSSRSWDHPPRLSSAQLLASSQANPFLCLKLPHL